MATPRSGLAHREAQAIVEKLFVLSESRGKEASGVGFLQDGSISVLRRAIPASKLIHTTEYRQIWTRALNGSRGAIVEPIAVIGHSRLVTNGEQFVPSNNQPVVRDGMVVIHNGIIANVEQLWSSYGHLERKSEVDTEVLAALIRHFREETGSLVGGVQRTFEQIYGVANIAVLFTDLDQVLLSTNSGSLYSFANHGGNVRMFASEEWVLQKMSADRAVRRSIGEGHISHLRPGMGCLIDVHDLVCREFALVKKEGSSTPLEKNGTSRSIVELSVVEKAPTLRPRPPDDRAPAWMLEEYERNRERITGLRRCKRCVQPETVPFVHFDRDGVCVYCREHVPFAFKGEDELRRAVDPHRKTNGRPDVLVPLSGGRDSCYALHHLKTVLGLNPLAYTYDWGMVTDLARRNASRLCSRLGIEHIIVSADIATKRKNIRMNVEAWMKAPDLGTIPLFMAGDKQFFWYAEQLKRRTGVELAIWALNPFERTDFKHGFCGISAGGHEGRYHRLPWLERAQIARYYWSAYLRNPAYLNSSLLDTAFAYFSYYLMPQKYLGFYDYVPWDESTIEKTLIAEYDWELSPDTKTTWRIGDGTASFYNYIYWTVAGFTENDTFRSFQIRQGVLDRAAALDRVDEDNRPRYQSISWYCDTVGIDLEKCLQTINAIPKLYSSDRLHGFRVPARVS